MSELTRCNYCTLQAIKARNPHAEVTLSANEYGWLDVLIDGRSGGHSFMAITEECVC